MVAEPVSLRDIPATVVDLLGLARRRPIPGPVARSVLGREQNRRRPPPAEPLLMETGKPPGLTNQGREPVAKGPMKSLVAEGMHYIRTADGLEELLPPELRPGRTKRTWPRIRSPRSPSSDSEPDLCERCMKRERQSDADALVRQRLNRSGHERPPGQAVERCSHLLAASSGGWIAGQSCAALSRLLASGTTPRGHLPPHGGCTTTLSP